MKAIAALLATLLLAVTACSGPTDTPVEETETEETVEVVLASDEEEHEDMMEMEMPEPLSAEDSEKYQADLPLEERLELATELAHLMPLNGMDLIRDMFPDLDLVEEISDEDDRNMMKMGAEGLFYSAEGDFTVQVCLMANSPMHVFEGTPADADFEEAMQMMEEMMHMEM